MARTIDPKVSGPVFDPAISDPWRDHPVAVPLVLLPVRVETRWFATGDPAQLELRVRIYPDAVHVANRADLSADEREQTIAYWRVRTADGEAAAAPRWAGLCADVGAARARWLRDRLAPTVGPDGQPQFPPPAPAASSVAVARGLPVRFALAMCAGAAVVGSRWGAPVPDELAVLDERDFAAAETVGLALRVTVARATAVGLTHLVVFGLRGGDPTADQAVLEDLLGDHAVDRGLALFTDGATTAAGDPGRPTVDAGGAGVVLDDACDGARLARALGVTRGALALAAGAARDTDAIARAMATATWPATWGYFLESIVGPPITEDARAAGRTLFVDDVRAAGPLPALAVGRQPYGILPVSALSRWRGEDGAVAPLAAALQALLPRWVGAGELAPRLPATGDALPALMAILARHERSTRVRVRTAMAYDVATATWFGEDVDDARRAALHAMLVAPLVAQLAALGVAVPDPAALTPLVYAEAAREVMAPLVGDGPEAPAYLAALAAAPDPWKIRDGEVAGASPRTVLYALLRHATLLVLGRAADRLLGLPTSAWREPDVVPSATASIWDRMAQPIAAYGGQSARALLQKGEVIADSPELRAHRDALRVLAASTVADLERATIGAIDVASHRLDAWVTALATRRLRTLRVQAPTGAHLGAYAWLTAPPVPATPVVDGAIEDRGSRGFILAPSLDHARTAAVLRSGFDARPTGDLAVELSSRRVQRGRALFDGLRAGHGLAELLGYEIERVVDDPAVVRVLRQAFPLAQDGEPDPNRARLDGLAAYQRWRATPPSGDLAGAAQAVFELVDGAADLLLAESIHQQIRGNSERAGATLASVAAGTVAPPPCAVVETPPTATLRRYQVVWGFAADGVGWPGDAARIRAVANPHVNAALAALLAPPTELRATIESGPEGAGASATRSVADLDLCALDLCALTSDGFAGSALEAAFAASVPEVVAPRVQPSSALVAALVIARGLREALGRAVPWGDASGPETTWATTATSLIGALTASADAGGARRLAAWLGAASSDASALQALAAARLAAVTGTAAERVHALSGFPPPRGPLTGLAPATELGAAFERIGWLADAARVRAPLAGVELVTTMTTVPTEAAELDGGTVVIVGAPVGDAALALRVDAWVEGRPSASHDGAVALHHDAPRARAPQAILVAVPPVVGAAWTPAALFEVVAETFDLVAARGARPSQVWGPTWPALYLGERLDRTTVSTAISELAVNLEVGD